MAVYVLFALLLIIGALLGLVAFFQLQGLRGEVAQLRARVLKLEPKAAAPAAPVTGPQAAPAAAQQKAELPLSLDLDLEIDSEPDAPLHKSGFDKAVSKGPNFWSRLRENWMVWLGGGCVALAGIFLARYGIEQGLLGPGARTCLGLVTALGLHIAAEWLRRRTGAAHPAFAALAGGGSIIAFATLLAALHLYQLIEPGLAFALLALVGVISMTLARVQGPVLAAIGMLGAYSVPLLVSTGSGNLLAALVYSLIISASVLLLLRSVYRPWLWFGLLAGGLGWWALSLTSQQPDGWRGLYLTAYAYLLLALVPADWLLRRAGKSANNPLEPFLPLGLALVVLAQCVSLLAEGFSASALQAWSPLALLLLFAARYRANLAFAPWLLFLGQGFAWLLSRVDFDHVLQQFHLQPLPQALQGTFLLYLGLTALLFSLMALVNLRRTPGASGWAPFWWASLAVMSPLLSLLLGYLLAGDYASSGRWGLWAAILGAIFLYLGSRGVLQVWSKALVIWLFAAGHFGYSLAVCLWLEQASLTLALALQSVSLAWIIRRFEVPALGWLLKGVLLLVVARLTFNPWLASYSSASSDPAQFHWSLWTYGGATLCAALAARLLRAQPQLARWAEVAALHLLVLTLWAQCRYWLYGGSPFADEYSFAEAVLNMWLFAGLGLVYYRKSLVSEQLARWYRGYGRVLMFAALANYGLILLGTFASSDWVWQAIGSRPLWNLLLPAFGGPVVLAYLANRYYEPGWRKAAGLLAAAAGFVWISLEIRHLWQGNIRLDTDAGTGELYTYSAVWLLFAVTAILGGSWRGWRQCYQGGMALLALVILKLFLVDMSDLQGLLRVASFMGLGLALLGIGYLHQKLRADT